MHRNFTVIPPSASVAWWLGALLAIPLAIIAVTWGITGSRPGTAAAMPAFAFGALMVIATAAITFWGLARRKVALNGRLLVIRGALFTHRLDLGELDLERARIIDLDEHTELRPVLKTFGMALPGFKAGWFLLRNRSRGFCLVTSHRRVLWLPAREGNALLLSLERPDAALEALREAIALPGQRPA